MKTELEILEEKVAKLKRLQANCNHEWLEPEFDPEKQEIKVVEDVWYGVDVWPEERGTGRYRLVDRWSRVCSKCGKKEYTKELEEIVIQSKTRPNFK